MNARLRTSVIRLGEHRGSPRIYLQGKWLIDAGFVPGQHFEAEFGANRITLTLKDGAANLAPSGGTSGGGRIVSGKDGSSRGVIDLNCARIREAFEQAEKLTVRADHGQIVITPARTAARRAQRVLTAAAVAMFAGGGLLSQAAKAAGFEAVAAVEINQKYADIYRLNHVGRMYCCSVEDVPWDELADLAPIGLLEMGIPCEPFSAIRRLDRGGQSKRNQQLPPEAHELGDMVYWALKAADVLNPHTVIVEQVPKFLDSGAGIVTSGGNDDCRPNTAS